MTHLLPGANCCPDDLDIRDTESWSCDEHRSTNTHNFEWHDFSRDSVEFEINENESFKFEVDEDEPGVPGSYGSAVVATVNFLEDAIKQASGGDLRSALRIVYKNAELMMRLGLLNELNEQLKSAVDKEADTDLLLALLTATLPAKSKLAERPLLYKATKRLLKKRKHYERGILSGLK